MALELSVTEVNPLGDGIWQFKMPAHQIRHFGPAGHSGGPRSVVLLSDCRFDSKRRELRFPLDGVVPLNIGTTDTVIGILSAIHASTSKGTAVEDEGSRGPGDRAFLGLARAELTTDMADVAATLLRRVRERSPGDLKRGKARNFSDTPDNFWYVIIQPQINELSITIRGSVDHFTGVGRLEIKDDRGNTRFKVRSMSDVDDALKLIFHAIRRS